jgi:PIN domain nuclease of toxin-antitoxin system
MTDIVLDASAVLAMVYSEPGGNKVYAAIVSPLYSVSISALNWCEVLTKLSQKSPIMSAEKMAAILPGVEVVPFSQVEAEEAASLAKSCPSISLGDRACLALASSLNAAAWTTDKIWAQIPVSAKLEMLR